NLAGSAANRFLVLPSLGDPLVDAAAGAVGFALAPAAAIGGAFRAGERLTPEQLSQCNSNLARAMSAMAQPQHFRDWIVKAAAEKTRRRLLPAEQLDQRPGRPAPVDAVLETCTKQLRLERTGSADTSFALHIQTRVRLLRVRDNAVLYEQPLEYRSANCLFLDWTLPGVFQKVADTGFRVLAERVVNQLLVATPEGPTLVGAGYRSAGSEVVHPRFAGSNSRVPVEPVASGSPGCVVTNMGTFGIYSTAAVSHVTLQRPWTKDEAAEQGVRNVEWALDGLDNHPNSVVMLTACATSIPMGLWQQTVGPMRGVSARQWGAASVNLTAAARQAQPHEGLAQQVAQQLAAQIGQPVGLIKKPFPPGTEAEFRRMEGVMRGTLAWLPDGVTASEYLVKQGVDTALEIQVVSAALTGSGGANPSLTLTVEVRARLLRACDGQELYCCPVLYRSRPRRFTAWAAEDARLFRQELELCYQQMASAMVEQLVCHRLIAPDRIPAPAQAGN
ncbi:MAG TPA: hypothetical protein VNT26_14430, partial [Candidatus Sulfotelmatobacter sp.]|nr:hypothetical protein [Candidatus Sulfotelmatobacter sp.]